MENRQNKASEGEKKEGKDSVKRGEKRTRGEKGNRSEEEEEKRAEIKGAKHLGESALYRLFYIGKLFQPQCSKPLFLSEVNTQCKTRLPLITEKTLTFYNTGFLAPCGDPDFSQSDTG